MIRAIIIDDEQHCIESLQILINKYCPEVEIVDTCNSGEQGLLAINKHDPDLVFLDIAMPKMNGFDMLSKQEDINFELIFTTAYDNYAIKAFKVSAADYLLKPIDRVELVNALETVCKRIELKMQSEGSSNKMDKLSMLLENLQSNQETFPNIALPTLEGLIIVKAEQILYVAGDSNYAHIYLKDKPPMLISKTIKYMEERLSKQKFLRIHNSYLINIHEVEKYIKGTGGSVVMSDGKQLSVAKNRKAELLKLLTL